jgi:mono/diheme cytochrome c family protein
MERVYCASALLLSAGLMGCGHSTPPGGKGDPVTLGTQAVSSVDWNANKADFGKIAAVTDIGQSTVVFSDQGMAVMVAGAVSANDTSVTAWQSAGVVPAADGEGQWIVGMDGMGEIFTVNANDQLENVSDRWGLNGQNVHAVAALGGAVAAFQLDGQLAVADGIDVTDYAMTLTGFSGAYGRVAGVSSDGKVHVFDLGTGNDTAYDLPGALYTTFDVNKKVVAATAGALYGEDTSDLTLLVDLSDTTVHGLAGSPTGVWVAMGTELGLLSGTTLGQSSGANLPADATIVASSSGDVWALSQGELLRYSANSPGDESLWNATILPIFDQVCSQCHLPGGTANIDLSYYGAWVARRKLIGQRVFQKMPTAMPPTTASAMLTADDLTAIQAWIDDTAPAGGGNPDGGTGDGG